MRKDQSILSEMYNLACERGHRSFSPDPMTWVGQECGGRTLKNKQCKKELFFIRDARDIPKRKVKVKRSKLLRIRRT